MVNNVLTKVQGKALNFIFEHSKRNGAAPTLRELCDYMGYKAVGSAQDLVKALRRKDFLVQPEKQQARSLSLTKKALAILEPLTAESSDPNTFSINCLGSVPAGDPIEAVEERVGVLRMSMAMFSKPVKNSDRLYAVRAKGLSMINAGICDGDWLVVESVQEADFGDIVIARLTNDATVKRLMKDARGWFLQPENDDFEPVYAQNEPFEVVGKVIALQRFL